MKVAMLVIIGIVGLGVAAPVQAGTRAPAKVENRNAELKQELQELRGDIEALRTAHQAHDKAAVKSAMDNLKKDWEALSPVLKKRIEENHPALFKALKERLAAHGKAANA